MSFSDLGLAEPLVRALEAKGYTTPTPIQAQAIPAVLEGGDLLGIAQTGTGKTAAFGLPMIQFVDPDDPDVQALVLTPTRELCIQVTQALRAYGKPKGIQPVAVFGGAPIVNVIVTMFIHPPKSAINPMLFVGFLLASIGAGMVLYFRPTS